MGELGLSPDSRDRSSPAFPVTNQVCSRSPNLLLTSSAGLPCRPPSLDETPCPCATPGSRPASSAGRGSTRGRRRTRLCHNRSRCTGPRSRPSGFSRTGLFVCVGTPWFPRAPPGRRTGRSPVCFHAATAAARGCWRGSRARRAGPLRFRKAARWLGRRFRPCAPRHRLGAAQKPGPRADRESMVRWPSRAPLDA